MNKTNLTELLTDGLTPETLLMIDFWAPWCGPCKAINPILEELFGDYKDRMVIKKINVDEERELASIYGITGIPCCVLVKDGQEVGRLIGAQSKKAYVKKIDELIYS